MGVGTVVYKRVQSQIGRTDRRAAPRALRSLAWLVTGMLLEHDVRLPRVALAMELMAWTIDRDWRLRMRVKGILGAKIPDGS